jgi:alpha 1,3-glucosidase
MWMNSAETFVDIFDAADSKKHSIWLSESGAMESFIFGATSIGKNRNGPKSITEKLALITGFLPLPPYFSLGFHYSKWEKISTSYLNDLLDNFNRQSMPLDILWLDIEHTDGKRYFAFDERRFQGV